MSSYVVAPSDGLIGSLQVPPDKSISHRVAIFAALAEGGSLIRNMLLGEDNLATLKALKTLGVHWEIEESQVRIHGQGLYGLQKPETILDLENSGTAMRLLTGILAAQAFDSVLIGDRSLMSRPMLRIAEPLRRMGACIELSAAHTAPIQIRGNPYLQGIEYNLPVASAQLKSCLLLAGMYANGTTQIREQMPSRNHTEILLAQLNYPCQHSSGMIQVQARGKLEPFEYCVPGDISSAAFFIVGAILLPSSELHLTRVGLNPTRTAFLEVLKKMGADIRFTITHYEYGEPVGDIEVHYAPLKAIELDAHWAAACIDELPILFVAAAAAKGVSKFEGVQELRVKESDRIAVMLHALQALGIVARSAYSSVEIEGGIIRGGVELDCKDDHRVAMALSIAAGCAEQETVLVNCAKVATSYPNFMNDAQALGFRIS